MVVDHKARTPASTGALALECDESQYRLGYGPCLHAAATGEFVEIADARTETRWPAYVYRAAQRGALGSLSLPLQISEGMTAALNVYVREANVFDDDSRAAAALFAPHATVAVSNMHAYQDARNMADNLEVALQTRAAIDQAKGILMERYLLTADQAFQLLARASMTTNTKVRDVADRLLRTGRLRGAPRS